MLRLPSLNFAEGEIFTIFDTLASFSLYGPFLLLHCLRLFHSHFCSSYDSSFRRASQEGFWNQQVESQIYTKDSSRNDRQPTDRKKSLFKSQVRGESSLISTKRKPTTVSRPKFLNFINTIPNCKMLAMTSTITSSSPTVIIKPLIRNSKTF